MRARFYSHSRMHKNTAHTYNQVIKFVVRFKRVFICRNALSCFAFFWSIAEIIAFFDTVSGRCLRLIKYLWERKCTRVGEERKVINVPGKVSAGVVSEDLIIVYISGNCITLTKFCDCCVLGKLWILLELGWCIISACEKNFSFCYL